MRQISIAVLLLLLPGCSLSNAFLGFPDFQQVDNETACRNFQVAFASLSGDCGGGEFTPELDALCPSRLNERDPRCASLFGCQQDTLQCVDGVEVLIDPTCAEQFDSLDCSDPFEAISVPVSFQIELDGVQGCGAVVDVVARIASRLRSSAGSVGTCAAGASYSAFMTKAQLPANFLVSAVDGSFGVALSVETLFVGDEVFLDESMLGDTGEIDLGLLLLSVP